IVLTPLTLMVESTQSGEARRAYEVTAIAALRLAAVLAIGVGAALHATLGVAVEVYVIFVAGALANDLQRRLSFIRGAVKEDALGGVASILLVAPVLLLLAARDELTLETALACIG